MDLQNIINKLEWSDNLLTGHTAIDNQHKKIVSSIKTVINEILLGANKNLRKIHLEELERLIRSHFSTEERLMKQYNYPFRGEHMREHAIFLQNVRLLKKALLISGSAYKLVEVILKQLTAWHDEHIEKYDKDLGHFITRHEPVKLRKVVI